MDQYIPNGNCTNFYGKISEQSFDCSNKLTQMDMKCLMKKTEFYLE